MVRTAVLLAAGEGSRLRGAAPSKPLCPVGGRPLIDHALAGFAIAGLSRAVVVLGYRGADIAAHLASRPQPLAIDIVWSDPRLPNGVSVLAAADAVGDEEALLAMCDHLVDPALYARVAAAGAGGGLRLGIDRRLGHEWVDPLDVTCVATQGQRIVAIGKELHPHDAYDTGVFAIGPRLFSALGTLEAPSLTQGVRILAAEGVAGTVDCSDLDWIDVDDAPALAKAEDWRDRLAA
ncbi:MAG TPA: NTP transferase domain-containing protein [Sphingomonas sp.]|jgi:1L-myo-inositol 1-phosphate cytidylyltransferase|nr:NTP transferase domain-containing protein [Sphingomonas sp.]